MRRSATILILFIVGAAGSPLAKGQENNDCANTTLEPFPSTESFDGNIVFRISHKGLEVDLHLCIFGGTAKRWEWNERISGTTVFEKRVFVPLGAYETVVEVSPPDKTQVATGFQTADVRACSSAAVLSAFSTSRTAAVGIGNGGSTCDPVPAQGGTNAPAPPPEARRPGGPDAPRSTSPTSREWIGLTAAGLAVATIPVLAIPRSRYFLLLLFSRVQGPAVLDQPTRSEIYDLIRQDPGIHANRITTSLALGSGETHYHLNVLRRNGLVIETRRGALRCFFPAGVASPARLRATAALRHEPTWRVYHTITDQPGASISVLASQSGLGMSAVSKAVDRLVEVGLARREAAGRTVLVRPTELRPLEPGLANISN